MHRAPLALALSMAAAACGGRVDLSTPDDAAAPSAPVAPSAPDLPAAKRETKLSGSFGGQSVVVRDAVAVLTTNGPQQELLVAYTDGTNLCKHLLQNHQQPDTHYVSLVILQDGASPIAPGTHEVTPPGGSLYVSGGYSSLDAVCQNNEVGNVAGGGTITLDTVTPSRVAGAFTIRFASGDSFEGAFDVPVCPASLDPPTRATCMP